MLYYLGVYLTPYFGPARLLTSRLNLIILGLTVGFIGTILLLPRFFDVLPKDRGREHAHEAERAVGKPTGAGVIFILLFIGIALLVVPFSWEQVGVLGLTLAAMLSGFLDDASKTAWGELKKGIIDLVLALAASVLLFSTEARDIWLPFTTRVFTMPWYGYIPMATALLWLSINTTNCSDGVDGVSSSLVLIALIGTGTFLYVAVGHRDFSQYLLLPHYIKSSTSAVMTFSLVGCLAGYLWYNAYPSHVLMGDAGSRALGIFMGIMLMKAGNPILFLIACSVILINGGTGLVKVGLLRFFKISIFHSIRFPLHDHFRKKRKWSNTQVLVRFALLQLIITIALIGALVKVR